MRVGNHQTLHVSNTMVVGNHNKIIGPGNTVTGNHNNIDGDSCQVTGNHNKGTGNNCSITGNHNTWNGTGNTMNGSHGKLNEKSVGNDNGGGSVIIMGRNGGISQMTTSGSVVNTFGGGDGFSMTIDGGDGVIISGNNQGVAQMRFNNHAGSIIGNVGDGGVTIAKKRKRKAVVPDETVNDTPVAAEADPACVICLANRPNCCIFPCAHKIVCAGCARTLAGDGKQDVPCPECRVVIKKIKRIFD